VIVKCVSFLPYRLPILVKNSSHIFEFKKKRLEVLIAPYVISSTLDLVLTVGYDPRLDHVSTMIVEFSVSLHRDTTM
jgi:hypothetical protein